MEVIFLAQPARHVEAAMMSNRRKRWIAPRPVRGDVRDTEGDILGLRRRTFRGFATGDSFDERRIYRQICQRHRSQGNVATLLCPAACRPTMPEFEGSV
jgi:hypothetical protein